MAQNLQKGYYSTYFWGPGKVDYYDGAVGFANN